MNRWVFRMLHFNANTERAIYSFLKQGRRWRIGGVGATFLYDSGGLLAVSEDAELDEDGYVLDHCAEGADEPGKVGEEVFFLDGVEEDLRLLARVPSFWDCSRKK